jgi:hypothetical protein
MNPHALPQLDGRLWLADGGLETTLVFIHGVDLPDFAAFPLLANEEGRLELRRYYDPYLQAAVARNSGFVLDTPTWRASRDWGDRLGWEPADWQSSIRSRSPSCADWPRSTASKPS